MDILIRAQLCIHRKLELRTYHKLELSFHRHQLHRHQLHRLQLRIHHTLLLRIHRLQLHQLQL